MSTDHTSLPALVSSVACWTVPPPTALSASFSAVCLEISPAANERELPIRTINRVRFSLFIAMFLGLGFELGFPGSILVIAPRLPKSFRWISVVLLLELGHYRNLCHRTWVNRTHRRFLPACYMTA